MQKIPTDDEINASKRKKNQNYKIFGILTFFLILFFLLYRIEAVSSTVGWFANKLKPIFWGVAMAYLLNPILLFFEKRFTLLFARSKQPQQRQKKLVKVFSITLTVIFGIVLLSSLLLLIIPEFLKSLQKLISIIPDQLSNFLSWLEAQKTSENPFVQNFGDVLQSSIDYFNSWLETNLYSSISNILSIATNSVISVVSFVINFFIAIVVAVYALMGKERFVGQSKKLLYAIFSPERANDILLTARHGHKVFGRYLSGKIITSLMIGIVCFTLMTIFKIPYPLLVSVIVTFTNVIPFFGPFIGGIPSALIILMTDTNKGIIFCIIIVVLQQIEGNIVTPRVLGTRTGISEFWVTFSLLLFGGLFGFVGMIIAVPLFAVVYYIVKLLVNRQLERKKLPVPSEDYLKVDSFGEDGFTYLTDKQKQKEKEKKDNNQ